MKKNPELARLLKWADNNQAELARRLKTSRQTISDAVAAGRLSGRLCLRVQKLPVQFDTSLLSGEK